MSIVPRYLLAFPTLSLLLHLSSLFCCLQLLFALMLHKQTSFFTSLLPLEKKKCLALCCELCSLLDGNKWKAIHYMKRSSQGMSSQLLLLKHYCSLSQIKCPLSRLHQITLVRMTFSISTIKISHSAEWPWKEFLSTILSRKQQQKLKSKILMVDGGHVVTLSYVVSTSEKCQMNSAT